MSQHYDPQQPNYSLDDILAEFGSDKPTPIPQPEPAPPPSPSAIEATQRVAISDSERQEHPLPTGSVNPTPKNRPELKIQASEEQMDPDSKMKVVPFPSPCNNGASLDPSRPDDTQGVAHKSPDTTHQPSKQTSPQAAKSSTDPMPVIGPNSLLRNLAARISTLRRRADNYADHMYDQAELDEAAAKVDSYLPGVDQETSPPPTPKKTRVNPHRARPSKPLPPDKSPAELATRFQKGLKARKQRTTAAFFLSILSILLSLPIPASLAVPVSDLSQLRAWLLSALLVLVGFLCVEVVVVGVIQLVKLHPQAETLVALAWVFSVADGVTSGFWPQRGDSLPCCAVTALGLTLSMWGRYLRQQGDRLSAKAAAQTSAPYVVSLDEDKWNHRPAYCKWAGSSRGFGSQLQMEDGGQRAYAIAAPILLVACTVCILLSSVAQQSPERLIWAASISFTASSSYCALLAFALPYQKLSSRLFKSGAAIAGWEGVRRCCNAGIILTDADLFPSGAVQIPRMEVYGTLPPDKVASYAATLFKEADCALTKPLYRLMQGAGGLYRQVTGVRFHEGGITGIIQNHEIFVGTSDFMHLVEVPLPRTLKVKHAIYCAVDGSLAAMFPVSYALNSWVRPSLNTLISMGVTPILATRDPNLIPSFLDQKFNLPVEKMEFPSDDRRRQLSDPEQAHTVQPVALLSREGVSAFCDTVVGCRRLRFATRFSLAFSLCGSALGVLLTFFLTHAGAYAALNPVNFLIFMLAWLLPQLLVAGWINQY